MFSKDGTYRLATASLLLAGLSLWSGCEGRVALIPVADPDLKRTSTQFAADSARRNYESTAPRGGDAQVMAAVDHGVYNRIQLENLSDESWDGVELWVNEKYVVYLNQWQSKALKKVNFAMLFDREGHSFPTDNKQTRVEKIEMLRNGKMYAVPMRLAD